jgi:hypothetical protein
MHKQHTSGVIMKGAPHQGRCIKQIVMSLRSEEKYLHFSQVVTATGAALLNFADRMMLS